MTASIRLHNTMFTKMLSAPMRFFDVNSSGRILNRFSKDMGTIDEILPKMLMDAIQVSHAQKTRNALLFGAHSYCL